jgi:glutamate 5-kinase
MTAAAAAPVAAAGAALFEPGPAPRLVVKVGSALLIDAEGTIRREWLAALCADLAARHAAGQRIVLVSSGSIALGSRKLGLARGGRASLEDAQAAAACGQILLAGAWAELLGSHGLVAAQMLLTLGDFEDRRRYLNAAATLDRLLTLDAVPILNENDSVATEEIRFGDNDRLAARAAQAAGADALILLSDIDGLYTDNPHSNPEARFIAHVGDLDAVWHMASAESHSGMGSGGMVSKLEAVRIAHAAGVTVAIVAGKPPHPLARFAATGHGTVFSAPDALRARKAWIAGRMHVLGRLTVDQGAVDALRAGKSLLVPGIRDVAGSFRRGDAVDVLTPEGVRLARGLVGYDAADLVRIAGLRREAAAEVLGHAPRAAVIHRDHLVLF